MGGRLLLSKWYVLEARAARERPPLRGNFHCSGRRLWRHDRLLRKEFLGCRTGAAESRPQAPESRPYRAFHCCGLRLGTSALEETDSIKRMLCPALAPGLPIVCGTQYPGEETQTFGSSGAGKEMESCGSTNMQLLWSREGDGRLLVLQTVGCSFRLSGGLPAFRQATPAVRLATHK